MNKIVIPGSIRTQLEAIAKSVFPLEIDAQLPVREIRGSDVVTDIRLDYEDVDFRAFVYSEDFKGLIRCLEHNAVDEFLIDRMKIDHKQARILFKRYKECQRKRSKGECKSVAVQSSSCENCPSYGQPRLPNLYGWFSNTPCVAWHSHVTSRYGNLDLLSRPSVVDSRAVAKLISLKNLPILGEMITCTSENGEQRTELYALPTAGVFDKQGERTRLSLN